MHFTNKLVPFEIEKYLRLTVLPVRNVRFYDDEHTYKHFGFKEHSKQARFFTQPFDNGIVAMLYEPTNAGAPNCISEQTVVARLFGALDKKGALELWHVSVNPFHRLNNSARGTRWGVHNIISDENASGKTRWTTLDGKGVTSKNARAHIRGTPNPYAVECIVRCGEFLQCPSIQQKDDMPCAKLFSSQYDQKTHPATMLIYEALRFRQADGLQYAWYRETMPGLVHSYEQCIQQMKFGLPVV